MTFWVYMATVILSLPKSMVFVALGSPSSEGSKAAKWGKVVAIGVVVLISGKSHSRHAALSIHLSLCALSY